MNGNDLNFNDVELEKERKALNYRDKLKQCKKKTHSTKMRNLSTCLTGSNGECCDFCKRWPFQ